MASVLGLLVSVVGFWYAIYLARSAKTAAEQARDAANAARDRIFTLDSLRELTTAKMALNEIIRLQRLNVWSVAWDLVLERYGTARESLIRCTEAPEIPEPQRSALRIALADVGIMVAEIETARIDRDPARLNTVRLNHRLSDRIAELERARIAIERVQR